MVTFSARRGSASNLSLLCFLDLNRVYSPNGTRRPLSIRDHDHEFLNNRSLETKAIFVTTIFVEGEEMKDTRHILHRSSWKPISKSRFRFQVGRLRKPVVGMHRASSIRNRTPIIANATAEVSVLVALSLAAANIGKNTRFVGRKGRRKEGRRKGGWL